jgi:hypothetical protein
MTKEQAQALYNEWKQSGETQRIFLARKQLKRSVFNQHYKSSPIRSVKNKRREPLQMLPVKVLSQEDERLLVPQDLVLEFANGKCLRFSVDTSVSYLSRLIGAIESRRSC